MRTLLIVDDEKNIRLGLKTMIEREYPGRYRLITAGQGGEALEHYRSEGADIVITDIRMPGMDGIALIGKLAEEPRASGHPQPLVIILSGYEDFEYAKAAIQYQVKDYLLKPIRRDELFAALRKCEEHLNHLSRMEEQMAMSEMYRAELQSRSLQELLQIGEIAGEETGKLGQEIGFDRYAVPFSAAVLMYKYDDGRCMNKEELKALAEHMLLTVNGCLNAAVFDREGRVVLIGGRKPILPNCRGLPRRRSWKAC